MAGVKLAFVDCETTGLTVDRHEIWELAVIIRPGDGSDDEEHVWQLPVDLSRADPMALSIGHYHERVRRDVAPGFGFSIELRGGSLSVDSERTIATRLVKLLSGAHLVGAVPSFDAAFLRKWLRAHGQVESWHYHLVTVEALAVGFLAGQWNAQPTLPWNTHDRRSEAAKRSWAEGKHSEELSRAVGVNPDDYDRHTALGDARWARAIYDAVLLP